MVYSEYYLKFPYIMDCCCQLLYIVFTMNCGLQANDYISQRDDGAS